MTELVTIWDGDTSQPHRGYLCCEPEVIRHAEDLPPAPKVPRTRGPKRDSSTARVRVCLQDGEWWTVARLCEATGWGPTTIAEAILRVRGRMSVESQRIDGESNTRRYRLVRPRGPA